MQDTAHVASAPITDADKARPTERAFRLLEHALLMGGTQWLFVAALLATRCSAHVGCERG
jgi:hypothetical protein